MRMLSKRCSIAKNKLDKRHLEIRENSLFFLVTTELSINEVTFPKHLSKNVIKQIFNAIIMPSRYPLTVFGCEKIDEHLMQQMTACRLWTM